MKSNTTTQSASIPMATAVPDVSQASTRTIRGTIEDVCATCFQVQERTIGSIVLCNCDRSVIFRMHVNPDQRNWLGYLFGCVNRLEPQLRSQRSTAQIITGSTMAGSAVKIHEKDRESILICLTCLDWRYIEDGTFIRDYKCCCSVPTFLYIEVIETFLHYMITFKHERHNHFFTQILVTRQGAQMRRIGN
jgi:hypothetical protein